MSQINIDYSVGPALTMDDLRVDAIDAPLSICDLEFEALMSDDTLFTLSELDDSILDNDTDTSLTLSAPDMSIIESEDTIMTVSELDDNNDKPFTLSELDVSVIQNCNTTQPLTMSDLETDAIDNDDCECAVCLEPINKNKNIAITKCKHTFCFQCIGQTLMDVGNNCPLCREELIEYNNIDDESLGSEDTETDVDEDNDSLSDDESVYSVSNLGRNYENELETSIVRIRAMGFDKGPIKEITDRFMNKGYTCYDLMTILFQQYDKNTTKDEEAIATHITKSIEDLNDINNEEREIIQMAENDVVVV